MKGFSSKGTALKVDVTGAESGLCVQTRPCSCQPGTCTGWGSDGDVIWVIDVRFTCVWKPMLECIHWTVGGGCHWTVGGGCQ